MNLMAKKNNGKKSKSKLLIVLAAILILFLIIFSIKHIAAKSISNDTKTSTKTSVTNTNPTSTKSTTQSNATAPAKVTTTQCSGNTLSKLVVVSISARHMWACSGSSVVYDNPVVTGMEFLPADLTPIGTYHIYGKLTDTDLKGCDSTGCWDDHVSYFLEFLDNQYGIYGFHDATWRPSDAFGNIDPNSSNASHGCVEMPLDATTWLFNWAPIGTTVNIIN
jgi:lipoprotein-anchoring transpeptidase ErfK/SrfK